MRRISIRYSTAFGSFASGFGVSRLAEALCRHGAPTAPTTVYGWLAGEKTPQPSRAIVIVAISGGAVKLEDVFAHRSLVRR